jgi:hypothetical protein
MRAIKFILLFISFSTVSYSQVKQDNIALKIKTSATTMGQLLLSRNYDDFLNYMYPDAIPKMGGRENIIKMIKDGQVEMEQNGTKIISVEFGEPSEILTKNNTLQCILPQMITLQVKGGTLKSKASLFAISSDNGNNWTFLDVTRKTKEQLKQIIPIFHKGLDIPAPTDPLFYED